MIDVKIVNIDVHDIRFPTLFWHVGSDAMHYRINHSCTYVIIHTNTTYKGYGIASTVGRGNEFLVQTCKIIFELVKGRTTTEIYSNFASFWRQLTTDEELRWVGPECGIVHLATAAIVNALWDLWARIENKPVWKLLTDMTPEELVSTVDFRYIRDVVTEEEAIKILRENQSQKQKNEDQLKKDGYPAYTADVKWWTYSNQQMRSAFKKFKKLEFKQFKICVGHTISQSLKRCELARTVLGKKRILLLDANQSWDQKEAKEAVKGLNKTRPKCIEEPTSSDDFLGHVEVLNVVKKLKYPMLVTCGETCANRVVFKQFLKFGAINFWNVNVGRLGGVNEALAVYFMAKKHNISTWGHAGGVGLGEMIQHLQIWNFICLGQSTDDVSMIEYTSHQHGYFEDPIFIRNSFYQVPKRPGFSTELKNKCIARWSYPEGTRWKHLFYTKHFKNELFYQKRF